MHKKTKHISINDLSLRLYDALIWAFIVFVLVRIVTGAHFFFNYFYFFCSNSIKLKKYFYICVVNMTELKQNTMKTIGFAGTFYTLWDVEVERVNVALGAWYDKVTCTYYKNLSKNLDEAIAKAGTDNVDESLKGKRKSFQYNKPLVIEPKIMTDRERLFRIILVNERENTLDARKEALKRMIELGYIVEKKVEIEEFDYDEDNWKKVIKNVYEVQGDVRFTDIWHHTQLDISIKGTI